MNIRQHNSADYAAIAELRWLFKAGDDPGHASGDKSRFIRRYLDHLAESDRDGRTVHWLIEDDGSIAGVMTVRIVPKEPAPAETSGSWGYLTNCFVRPEMRNRGLGTRLVDAVRTWGTETGLELLIVWPSEPSYAFYRRAGFKGRDDPLELLLNPVP